MKRSFFFKEGLRQWRTPLSVTLAKKAKFPFSLIPFHPAAGNIMATHNCNSRCLTCSMWKNKSKGELTTAEMFDVLSQLREAGNRRVCFSGGEPLLRDDLSQIVRKTRELGFEHTQVITNGLLLSANRARELLENGLNRITISIDGSEEVHDRQRGIKGAYKKSMAALEFIVSLRDQAYPNLDIEVSTTLTQISVDHMSDVIKMCKELNITWMPSVMETLSFEYKDVDESLVITGKEMIDRMADELHHMKKGYPISTLVGHVAVEYVKRYLNGEHLVAFRDEIPCTAGFTAIYVDAHGKVFPGCWAQPPVGDLREKRLKDILKAAEFRLVLRRMFAKQTPMCPCPNGYFWSVWYYVPTVFKEGFWGFRFMKKGGALRN